MIIIHNIKEEVKNKFDFFLYVMYNKAIQMIGGK
nr:MAG TPA: hypothetical protein [Caudoviricetes sp.]